MFRSRVSLSTSNYFMTYNPFVLNDMNEGMSISFLVSSSTDEVIPISVFVLSDNGIIPYHIGSIFDFNELFMSTSCVNFEQSKLIHVYTTWSFKHNECVSRDHFKQIPASRQIFQLLIVEALHRWSPKSGLSPWGN